MKINEIICGDALEVLKTLPSESIDCCITSPPYFNLRNYNVTGQIGLETTYQEFIEKLLSVFLEVKRILKKEGTCFINLGDSYASIGKTNGDIDKDDGMDIERGRSRIKKGMYMEKCLFMIPERFAISMIEHGWILRNKLVWVKPNAMPESVQDRWKKAHEYIFFFVKSKKYYFDLDVIRIQHKEERYEGMPARMVKLNPLGGIPPDFFYINANCSENDTIKEHHATYPRMLISSPLKAACPVGGVVIDPFFGFGTTGLVAKKLGRNYIGIDLNPDYCKLAEQRLRITDPLF